MKKLILIPILFLSYFMHAQYIVVKPSQLPAASTINLTDLFILNQGTTTKKVTYSILNTVLKDTFLTKKVTLDSIAALRGDIGTGGSQWTTTPNGISYSGAIFPGSIKKWDAVADTLFAIKELTSEKFGFHIKTNSGIFINSFMNYGTFQNIQGNANYATAWNIETNSGKGFNIQNNTSNGFNIDSNAGRGLVIDDNQGTGINFSGTGKHIRMTSTGTDTTEVFNQTSTGLNQVFKKNGSTVWKVDGDGVLTANRIIATANNNSMIGGNQTSEYYTVFAGVNSGQTYNSTGSAMNLISYVNNVANFRMGINNNSSGLTASGHNVNLTRDGSFSDISFTGNFINIDDNPSTTGTISGKVLSATIGINERISLNPRATGTVVPYIFQSHNKITGHLFELGVQDRVKIYADSIGNVVANTDTLATRDLARKETFIIALSGEKTNLVVDTLVGHIYAPYPFQIVDMFVSTTEAPTGATVIYDIKKNFTSIFSTKISIDASEKTSLTAATAYVLTGTTTFAKGDYLSIRCDQIGSTLTGKGGQITINVKRLGL
jgi:hypothetical protein